MTQITRPPYAGPSYELMTKFGHAPEAAWRNISDMTAPGLCGRVLQAQWADHATASRKGGRYDKEANEPRWIRAKAERASELLATHSAAELSSQMVEDQLHALACGARLVEAMRRESLTTYAREGGPDDPADPANPVTHRARARMARVRRQLSRLARAIRLATERLRARALAVADEIEHEDLPPWTRADVLPTYWARAVVLRAAAYGHPPSAVATAVHDALCEQLGQDPDSPRVIHHVAHYLGLRDVDYADMYMHQRTPGFPALRQGGPAAQIMLLTRALDRGVRLSVGPEGVWCESTEPQDLGTSLAEAVHGALCEHIGVDAGRGSRKAVAEHLGISPAQYRRYVTAGGPAAQAHLLAWARERGITVHIGPTTVWCHHQRSSSSGVGVKSRPSADWEHMRRG